MLNENEVRRLLFFQALAERDKLGVFGLERLVESLGRELRMEPPRDPSRHLTLVAERLEQRFEKRHATHAREWYADRGRAVFRLLAPLLFLLGLFSNYLGPNPRVNLLLNPLMVLLAWNLAVYLLLLIALVVKKPCLNVGSHKPFHRSGLAIKMLFSKIWWAVLGHKSPATEVLFQAKIEFLRLWYGNCGTIAGRRFAAWLHALAMMLVLGVIAGLYLRGLVQSYQFDWSSTFIKDPQTLKRLLGVLFGPALFAGRAIFPGGPPEIADSAGAAWIHLFAWSAFLYVVLPRGLMAAYNFWRAAKLAGRIALDSNHPFLLKLAALSQQAPAPLILQSYSYRLSSTVKERIYRAAQRLWGSNLRPRDLGSLAWGTMEVDLLTPEMAEGMPPIRIMCFNGLQTPEEEVYGPLMESLLRRLRQLPQKPTLVVVVDHGSVAPEQKDSRREAWRHLFEKIGLHRFSWLDLNHELDSGPALKAFAEGVWSESP